MIPHIFPLACLPLLAVNTGAVEAADQTITEHIIVTAPGQDRKSGELVSNATALERDDLIQVLEGSLGNTLSHQPGVSTTFFGQGASRPVLRGLGAERVQILANAIGVIDASAASPDHQLSTGAAEAEKIEILRGPVALPYGGQAIGGVVNVIDRLIAERRPEKPVSGDLFGASNSVNNGLELSGRAQFAAGPVVFNLSATQRDFNDYDIPGLAESAALRAREAAANPHDPDEHDEDGHDEAHGRVENTFVDTRTLAAGLSLTGSDDAFVGASIRQQKSTYGLPGHSHEEHDADHGHEEETSPFIDLEHVRVDLRGGTALAYGPFTGMNASLSVADYEHAEFEAPGETGTRYTSEGVEARLVLDHKIGPVSGSVGLQCIDKKLAATGEESVITPTDTRGCAVFLYEIHEWENGTGIEGGARIERLTVRNREAQNNSFDLFSGSFGVHRHFANGWFAGGQFSWTQRAPNESELYANGPHLATRQYEVGRADFDRETGTSFEASIRWNRDPVRIGMNLFMTSFSGFIFLQPGKALHNGQLADTIDNLPVFLFTQDDASFTGGEIYGEMALDDGLFGADWKFTTSLDLVNADLDKGGTVPLTPPATFNMATRVRWDRLEVAATVSVAGRQNDVGAGGMPTNGYQMLDLHAAIPLPGEVFENRNVRLFVDARNVTNEEVRFATSVLKDVAPAPGRNIRIGLRMAF